LNECQTRETHLLEKFRDGTTFVIVILSTVDVAEITINQVADEFCLRCLLYTTEPLNTAATISTDFSLSVADESAWTHCR